MIEVKLIATPKPGTAAQGAVGANRYTGGSSVIDEAKHAGRADKADFADTAEYANRSGYASRAAFADDAAKWDGREFADYLDQPTRKKDAPTFDGVTGARFAGKVAFIDGVMGKGFKMWEDEAGTHACLDELTLRRSLTVPELRFNRVSVYTGIRWDTCGGGLIEDVLQKTASAGAAYLKLEDGEAGAIEVGDLCMGIWHDTAGGNATATTDDRRGRFAFRGFKTVFFRIDAIPQKDAAGKDNSDKHYFTYVLRADAAQVHPFAQMHFAARGNVSNAERQAFTYTTTEYTLMLAGVNDWEFSERNYKRIAGKLDGFSFAGKAFHGHGEVLCDAYIYGAIEQFENAPIEAVLHSSRGETLVKGEETILTVSVRKGFEDITDSITDWTLLSDAGMSSANVRFPRTISYNDLSKNSASTLFTATGRTKDGKTLRASLAIKKVKNGEQPIVLQAYIARGSNFYHEGQAFVAEMRAAVFRGGKDVTSEFSSSQIVWTRESEAGTAADEAWNFAHTTTRDRLTIGAADLSGDTSFIVSLYDEAGRAQGARRVGF